MSQHKRDSVVSPIPSTHPQPAVAVAVTQICIYFRTALFTGLLLGTFLSYWALQIQFGPFLTPKSLGTLPDRLVLGLHLQVYSLIPLLFSLVFVIHCRITGPALNPLSGNEHYVKVASRILVNTFEQYLFHAINLLVFSTLVSERYFFLLPLTVAIFVLGRLAFAVGYLIHPVHRQFGFIWTFFPSLGIFLANLIMVTCGFFSSN